MENGLFSLIKQPYSLKLLHNSFLFPSSLIISNKQGIFFSSKKRVWPFYWYSPQTNWVFIKVGPLNEWRLLSAKYSEAKQKHQNSKFWALIILKCAKIWASGRRFHALLEMANPAFWLKYILNFSLNFVTLIFLTFGEHGESYFTPEYQRMLRALPCFWLSVALRWGFLVTHHAFLVKASIDWKSRIPFEAKSFWGSFW